MPTNSLHSLLHLLIMLLTFSHIKLSLGGGISKMKMECQGVKLTSERFSRVENVCLESAPEDTEEACFRLCIYTNMRILKDGKVSETGIEEFVDELYPDSVREKLKESLGNCASIRLLTYERENNKYQEDTEDLTCGKGREFVKCFQDVTEKICGKLPSNHAQPKFEFKYSKKIVLKNRGGK